MTDYGGQGWLDWALTPIEGEEYPQLRAQAWSAMNALLDDKELQGLVRASPKLEVGPW